MQGFGGPYRRVGVGLSSPSPPRLIRRFVLSAETDRGWLFDSWQDLLIEGSPRLVRELAKTPSVLGVHVVGWPSRDRQG